MRVKITSNNVIVDAAIKANAVVPTSVLVGECINRDEVTLNGKWVEGVTHSTGRRIRVRLCCDATDILEEVHDDCYYGACSVEAREPVSAPVDVVGTLVCEITNSNIASLVEEVDIELGDSVHFALEFVDWSVLTRNERRKMLDKVLPKLSEDRAKDLLFVQSYHDPAWVLSKKGVAEIEGLVKACRDRIDTLSADAA